MTGLDWIFVIGFLVFAAGSGWIYSSKASESLEEYFLAGRSVPGWQAGLSMSATQFASDTPLLVTGLVAVGGIFSVWQMWSWGLSFILMGVLLGPCWRRAKVLTDAELTELRYGSRIALWLRVIKAVYFGTVFNCIVLAWVIFAGAKIAQPFFLWDQWLDPNLFLMLKTQVEAIGVPLNLGGGDTDVWVQSTNNLISVVLIVVLALSYSTTGGLRAVIKTDIVQLSIMLFATFAYAIIAVYAVGGVDVLYERLSESLEHAPVQDAAAILSFTPENAPNIGWAFLFAIGLQWIIQLNSDGTGYLAQRCMACKTEKDVAIAATVFSVVTILLRTLMWLPIAVALIIIFPFEPDMSLEAIKSSRESTFVLGMNELLPVGIKGLMVTAMIAALASTVDTHLNWGSSYWTNDLYKRFLCQAILKKEPSPRSLVWVARVSNVIIMVIALWVATLIQSIHTVWQITLLLGAGVGPILLLRWFWWRINSMSELVALIVSFTAAIPVFMTVESEPLRLLIVSGLATSIGVIMGYVVEPNRQTLQEFYQRVKPPGFWGPFSKDSKGDTNRMWQGLLTMAVGALALFSFLVSLGSMVVDAPAPLFLPYRPVWLILVLLIAIVAATIYWRRLKSNWR